MIGSLAEAADRMRGSLHGDDRAFSGISTDTRSLKKDELFFALAGPNFDAHEYLDDALCQGAAGAVVSRRVDSDIGQIVVDDVKLALGRLASAWRRERKSLRVVGITGSNGKTTVKELVAACLRSAAPTLATAGNLNNEIGVPLMLSRIRDEHKFAVIEMGANHAGEIAYLTGLVKPDVVTVTNAGSAHLEGFGSIEGVAHAKGEIFDTEERPSVAVLNADDAFYDYWRSLVEDVDAISFGIASTADVHADSISANAAGSQFELHLRGESLRVSLPLPGTHNVLNACAAAACAHALGIEARAIKNALESIEPVEGRLEALAGINGCTLFDDSYNANPISVAAAAEFLASLDGEGWLVLADMKELGEGAEDLHREVGASARASGVDRLFALGDLTKHCVEGFGDGARWYAGIDALIRDLSAADQAVTVLVKGSRSMHMERVVDALRAPARVRKEA